MIGDGKVSDKSRRGWVRISRRHPEAKQRASLEEAGAGEIYVDNKRGENITAFINSLREASGKAKRDTALVHTLGRLGKSMQEINLAVAMILNKNVVIVETSTGRTSDKPVDMAAMMAGAELELRLERKRLTSKQAKLYGAKGNAAIAEARDWFPTPDDIKSALPIWKNTTTYPRAADALEAMREVNDRWNMKAAYNKLGRRLPGTHLGRPKIS